MTDTTSFNGSDSSLFSLAQIQHLMRVEFNRAQRYDYPIVCMMIAVDRLGHLRDLYGYEAKEEILSSVVSLLKAETRGSDFLGRMADDRLLAVIPHTPPEGAIVLAGRLLEGVSRIDFSSEGRTIQVTLSIGSSNNEGGETLFFDAMLLAAEDALGEAVAAGGARYLTRSPGETMI
ncbi:MAG: GGDEF domain-containing protein [Planctomycetota bacterium]|nr:MAG: GGDEF domain-containing protein [Planctomycetota bacterium]